MYALVNTLILLAASQTALAGVIKTLENHIPTIYYENLRCDNGNPCAATWGPTWSDSIVSGYTKCENKDTTIAKPLSYYKSNQIVAIDLNLFQTEEGLQKYCGKKVRVTKPDGTEYISPGGDLFVWDSCEASPDQLLLTGSTGDECGVGAAAYKIEILDESVVEYGGHPPNAPGGVDTFKGTDVGGAAVCVAAGADGSGLSSVAASSPGVSTASAVAGSAESSAVTGITAGTSPAGPADTTPAIASSQSTLITSAISAVQSLSDTDTAVRGSGGGGRVSHWS